MQKTARVFMLVWVIFVGKTGQAIFLQETCFIGRIFVSAEAVDFNWFCKFKNIS